MIASIASFSLLDSLLATDSILGHIKPITNHWAIRLNEYCSDLKKESISIQEWQQHIAQLYQEIELSELLQFIDFDKLIKGFQYPDLGVHTLPVKFPELSGLPERTAFVKKIFGMKKDRAIIPHGHSNMVSAHLILKGEMYVRHYDKIRIEDQHMIIKPSIDKVLKLGENSSISDDKDNVHWFVANSESAFTFDIILLDLYSKPYDIHNLDIYEKQHMSDGSMRVPMLTVERALKKYGKETHH